MIQSQPNIVITGANGFIGSYLVNYFLQKGFIVKGLCHHTHPDVKHVNFTAEQYELNKDIKAELFEQADYVIHCAIETFTGNKNNHDNNIQGTLKLRDYCRNIGIKRFVFISSMSAHENSLSQYGKTKFFLEKQFDQPHELVFKPGLVLGNGGLFRKIDDYIRKHTLIPLIDGGRQPLQTLHIQDLAKVIEIGLEKEKHGIFAISENEAIEIRNLYSCLANIHQKKIVFVNLPYFILKFTFNMIQYFHIPFKLTSENLLGLKQLQAFDVKKDLNEFEFTPRTYSESIEPLSS